LLRDKKTKDEFLLRNICSNIGEEINELEELMKIRQGFKSAHLL
jgi:hypothetical protein